MPTISMFFGIMIRMYYEDHAPPHFHVYYGSASAVVEIATLELSRGSLPRRARALVLEWASAHREELLANWLRAERHEPLADIEPLE